MATRSFTRNQVKYRWQAIDQENEAMESKTLEKRFEPMLLTNHDTIKQLQVAISYTKTNQSGLKTKQNEPKILFELYPDIKSL
jgi:ribosomal protein S2